MTRVQTAGEKKMKNISHNGKTVQDHGMKELT